MATRQDQLHSYQFMLQRVISALVIRETDPAQSPLRRGVGAVFAGVMIAILVGAGFGVYGIFTGIGSLKWKTDGAVVVEKETGAVYVYRSSVLHPMLNYASALLAGGSGDKTFRVNADELSEVPRGVPAGIPGAPTSLPSADSLLRGPWTLCSVPDQDSTGAPTTTTALTVGSSPSGGTRLGERGLLVADPSDDSTYLVWHSHRFQVTDADKVVPSLFGGALPDVTRVGTAWLNGLPAGLDIGPIDVPQQGTASSVLSGHHVGDVLYAQTGSGPQYFLLFDDGVAVITALQKDIVLGQYPTQPQRISMPDIAAAPKSKRLTIASDRDVRPPAKVPSLATMATSESVCTKVTGSSGAPAVVTGAGVDAARHGVPSPSRTGTGGRLADRILVPPGRAAVVRSLPSGSSPGAYNVVTDVGQRYPVRSAKVLKMLGYSASDAVSMPAGLVNSIPAGPALNPAAALLPVTDTTHGR